METCLSGWYQRDGRAGKLSRQTIKFVDLQHPRVTSHLTLLHLRASFSEQPQSGLVMRHSGGNEGSLLFKAMAAASDNGAQIM